MLKEERDDSEDKRASKKITAIESRMIGTISRTSRRWKNDGDANLFGKELKREHERQSRRHRDGFMLLAYELAKKPPTTKEGK